MPVNIDNRCWDKLTPEEQRAIDAVQQFHPYKITQEYSDLIDWGDRKSVV